MTRILEALKNNNLTKAKQLINLGQTINDQDEQGFTALHLAVLNYDLELAHHLLEAGACPNMQASNQDITESNHTTSELISSLQQLGKTTPIHISIQRKNTDMLKLLLAYRANPNILDAGLCTPSHWAAAKGRTAHAQILLDYGAQVNARDLALSTPLHEAVRNSHLTLIQLLLNYKADYTIVDITGYSPIMMAKNDAEAIKYFKKSNIIYTSANNLH